MNVDWEPRPIRVGQAARLVVLLEDTDNEGIYKFIFDVDTTNNEPNPFGDGIEVDMRHGQLQDFEPELEFTQPNPKTLRIEHGGVEKARVSIPVLAAVAAPVPTQNIALVSADPPESEDQVLWTFIRLLTNQLRFDEFHQFVEPRLVGLDSRNWFGNDAYRQLVRAAEEFVESAADPVRAIEHGQQLQHELRPATVAGGLQRSYVSSERDALSQPFLDEPAGNLPVPRPQQEPGRVAVRNRAGVRQAGQAGQAASFPLPNVPFVELIWSYWIEEGGLVQTMNHILARFQNRRVGAQRDPLGRFDLNPLLPLRSLLWGFTEDERRRLTIRRRAAEYMVQYGLPLVGRAVPPAYTVVDRRTQFLEGYHNLLHEAHSFYKERDDKTVDADAFPLLSTLREVHLVLAHGAHNQFADLPLVARAEMLTMQWILGQPEFRTFLGGPTMVPYEEDWMDRVETMKTLMGWPAASITHFFELAFTGEQIVLSIRHGRWNETGRTREDAANWALTWRNEIQRYMHAYRAVTGVDLTTTIDATPPSLLLTRRSVQRGRPV